jgi:hypothetical protein
MPEKATSESTRGRLGETPEVLGRAQAAKQHGTRQRTRTRQRADSGRAPFHTTNTAGNSAPERRKDRIRSERAKTLEGDKINQCVKPPQIPSLRERATMVMQGDVPKDVPGF